MIATHRTMPARRPRPCSRVSFAIASPGGIENYILVATEPPLMTEIVETLLDWQENSGTNLTPFHADIIIEHSARKAMGR